MPTSFNYSSEPMVSEKVGQICNDIKSIKIQGARNIAQMAVKALNIQAQSTKAKTTKELLSELIEVADLVASTRPTEPMLRNAIRNSIRFFFMEIKKKKATNVSTLKKLVAKEEKEYLAKVEANLRNIAEFGAQEIPDNSHVLVHCHSSTLINILKRTRELDKDIMVTCTETRPKYQGHMTAKDLRDAGISVRMIIDDAVKYFIHEIDLVLVGADAITSSGDLINKIGTSTIASVAHEAGLPMYVAAELHKFDPMTLWGHMEAIEERNPSEIADPKEFKGVTIVNPAFDITQAKYISAYITELGLIPPQSLLGIAMQELNFENPMVSSKKSKLVGEIFD